jgi:hypothetical protein
VSAASHSLSQNQFVLVAANLIHRFLIEPGRVDAKKRFRDLEGGQLLALQTVEMEDKSRAQFGLSLDHSEYRGKLNYSAFRSSLEILLVNLSEALKAEKDVASFDSQEDGAAKIFAVTGPTVDAEQVNVLVLGMEPDSTGQATVLKLMYLDPAQFEESPA